MSIQDEINRINQNIANTYTALGDMGATLPQVQNSANMASAVRTIPQSGGGGTDNCTFAISCYLDLATMSMRRKDGGLLITEAEAVEAFESNKYIFCKLDTSQLAGVEGVVSYCVAPMTQFAYVPLAGQHYMMNFDFIMAINGVPHLINAEMWVNQSAASVALTPLATA